MTKIQTLKNRKIKNSHKIKNRENENRDVYFGIVPCVH